MHLGIIWGQIWPGLTVLILQRLGLSLSDGLRVDSFASVTI